MDITTLYDRIPVLFWLTMVLIFLSILPMLIVVYALLFECLDLRLKFFNTHFMPENKNNKCACDVQNDQCSPGNPESPVNSHGCNTNDPNNNDSSQPSGL